MMESCLAGKPVRIGPVEVNDIKRNLLEEFSALPKQEEVQSRSGNLQVYLRIRPLTGAESGESQDCVAVEGPHTVVLKVPRSRQADKVPQTAQRFTFTQVFGPDASQRKVFEGSVHGLVRDVLHGQNCLLFTYGVTNAGKTFTFLGPDHDSGLLPRCLRVIFNSTEGRLCAGCDLKPHRCRDFVRLTPKQQRAESAGKTSLLRTVREIDNNATARSTSLDASSLSSDCSLSESDRFILDVAGDVRFSVWVSFCEIYNDNIHDLLEQVAGGQVKRTALRLSQDIKGNSFIRDLRWIQVSSSEEAYKVVKIGRKNQSSASTKLNHQSSRSHSIFSIRILRTDDSAAPRFLGVSELALCDLAGSERCSRTRNTGERLKEAGNINSSLLALGKCINAMRVKQNAKFQHHVPFRESKLTHFLQFFFCGASKVSMVVNINQNSSCVDETLNVLKFSALAQKVVVLSSQPTSPEDASLRSATEVSFLVDGADRRGNLLACGRKSSAVAWETTLEDVMEDEDEEEESGMEETVLLAEGEDAKENESDREVAYRSVVEAKIREEVFGEFMQIFNKMEQDYSEHLERERQILEERAEARLEIQKNLLIKTAGLQPAKGEEEADLVEGIIRTVSEDLKKIRADAQSAQRQLLLANQADRTAHGQRRGDDKEEEGRRTSAKDTLTPARPEEGDQMGRLRADNAEKDGAIARLTEEVRRLTEKERACPARLRETRQLAQDKEVLINKLSQVSSVELELQQEVECGAVAAEARPNADAPEAQEDDGADVTDLRGELLAAAERSARKSKVIQEVMQEKMHGYCDRECEKLAEQLANQKAEYCRQIAQLRAELECQRSALEKKMNDDLQRQEELERVVREKEALVEEHKRQTDALRRELERGQVRLRDGGGRVEKAAPEEEEEMRRGQEVRPQVTVTTACAQLRASPLSAVQVEGKSGARKRKSCQVQGLSSSDDKRTNVGNVTQEASPSVPRGAAKAKRGRRKLYGKEAAAPFIISPRTTCAVADGDEKQSDHMIIKRQLRSKTGRK
ncbi:kinesin-like protein KIF20B [Syngnathoides biaculeatus]|uniref:kinesin-like protein KIF20B n=1 Tax=Syngnathoides biaculeatus TaxID=300417 RepID=UPI002ADE37D2|nr:kinesin-like protein KIF20B [Syngnathoides biaculeatus]XP_061665836.1 kinesin-like protein KIF20B [Syngnathoides biaculeatus]